MSTNNRILNADGKGNYPFKVPERYFDHLTARIMEQIPEEEVVADKGAHVIQMSKSRRKWWIGAASAAASVVLIVTFALKFAPNTATNMEELRAEYTDEDYNEDLLTYVMADNMAVYDYLSGSNEE